MASRKDPAWFGFDTSLHLQSILAGNGDQGWGEVRENVLARHTSTIDTAGTERENPSEGFGGQLSSAGAWAILLAAGLGASSMGSDWRTGVMESELVIEPRRRRLIGAKMAAIATAGTAVGLVATALGVIVVLPAAIWRGDMDGTGMAFLGEVALIGVRVALGAALFAVLAASISLVARNTAVGIVSLVIWSIAGGVLADQFGGLATYPSPVSNVTAFVAHADVSYWETVRSAGGGLETFEAVSHTYLAAGAAVALIAAVLSALGSVSFAHRDVA